MIITTKYIKAVTINTETKEIISIVDSVEIDDFKQVDQKKKAPTKVSSFSETSSDVCLKEGKLILSKSLIEDLMEVSPGDRIAINYLDENGVFVPVISKSSVYGDESTGNKLTKTGTVSFKGKQGEMLSTYGTSFKVEKIKDGVFKLISEDSPIETISDNQLEPIPLEFPKKSDDLMLANIEINKPESLDDSENLINFELKF